ncbi:MAG TPA: histidinol dehydrogenase [Epulopiscium sp.]|nr:histidinol dehydrogenase [Candidatus Epulonipiscium sp.]
MVKIIKDDEYIKFFEKLKERAQFDDAEYAAAASAIVAEVKKNRDQALFMYTEKFDKVSLTNENIKVTKEEIDQAYEQVGDNMQRIIKRAADRIRNFHSKQKRNSWMDLDETGSILGQLVLPMESCGVYVPGGKAAYPSSVLMNIIPAQVAGVEKIVMVTPPQKGGKINPVVLVSADIAGVTEIYKVGGAQSIAALAFGTESIPKVDKIVGPGNIYVALAKREVYGYVSIDSIAGPSEILILADKSANPKYVAADMLSQAEHDELASSVVVTDCEELALAIAKEVEIQTNKLSRKVIIEKSLRDFGAIIVTKTMEEAIKISNDIAPEHLEICTDDPFNLLPKIKNAGAIFLGHYTPEPVGDYMAGPNHVLPTNGTARFFSPLCVDDFIKKPSILSFTKDSLELLYKDVMDFAESEELTAHANALRVRYDD